MVISIILLAVLFIAGFVNIFFYFPTKKFYSWIQSFIKNRSSAVVSTAVSSNPQVVSSSSRKERSAYKKAELKRIFGTFDKDGDEFITQEELIESFKNLRLSVTAKEVEEMVVKVDANGDGLIDFDEFCTLYEAMVGENHPQDGIVEEGPDGEGDLKEAFDVFDKDHDGLISVEELGFVLSSLGLNEGKKIENCKEMIRKVDMDGDGMVNFDEFKRMMKAGGRLEVETNQKEISIHGL